MYLRLLLLLSFSITSSPRLVNVTIDDTYGDAQTGKKPDYLPEQGWLGLSDLALVHNRTASYALVPGNISMEFEGSTIYVFLAGIPPQQASWPGLPGAIVFYLDGDTAPAWKTAGPGIPGRFDQVHSQLAFTSDQLAPGRHSLVSVFFNGVNAFDYAVYTKEVQDSPSSSVSIGQPTAPSGHRSGSGSGGGGGGGNNPPATRGPYRASALIGGSVAGAVALIGLPSWILVWRCRRRRRRRAAREHERRESTDETAAQNGADSCSDDAISPFVDVVSPASGEKDAWQSALNKAAARAHHDAGARPVAEPSNLHPNPTTAAFERGGREEDTFRAQDVQPRATGTAADESSADIRAELQRMRAEIEHLRQVARAAEPPPYSDGGRSEFGDRI